MPNISGKAYALTTFCPIKNGQQAGLSNGSIVRKKLQELPEAADSPMAGIPNTYLARFYVLDNAIFQSYPFEKDTLQSQYLAFSVNLHGDLDTYLTGMWDNASATIKDIWADCVGFEHVNSTETFKAYIKKCQVNTTFFFNGSTDDSLAEQLKSLFLKQEFSKFVFKHQNVPAPQLLADFKEFIAYAQPKVLTGPTWRAGSDTLDNIVVNNKIN